MDSIRILIVDDHPVVREGLAGMLAAQPDFLVVGQANNGLQALQMAAQLRPTLIIMDLRMPGMDGLAAIRAIKEQGLPSHILVLTTYDSDTDILPAIEAGATGYLLKDIPREELFKAIRSAAKGETILAPVVAAALLKQMRRPAGEKLSQREIEVLELVAHGLSNQEIAKALHVSNATVKTHLIHIFNKLGVDDRTAAVTAALARGILNLPSKSHPPIG
jgi:DNA-binding NarL/FixJ family response regulator